MTVSYSNLLGGNPIIGTIPVASGGTGTASLTGLLKGNGTSAISTAAAGTDYIVPGSGLGTPTSGVLTNCTGYTYANLTGTVPTWNQNTTGTAAGLSATLAVSSGGTGVTTSTGSGSVVLSNTPTLLSPLLGTPTSGVLTNCTGYTYANLTGTIPTWNQNTTGTAASLSATLAVSSGGTGATSLAGANIPVTTANNIFTGTQSFTGTSSVLSSVFTNLTEVATVSTLPSATLSFYIATQSIILFTSNSANNWTLNITYSAGTTLNSVLAIGQAVTIAFIVTNSATAYYNSATQVDGVAVTPKWQGGTAPTAGNASSLDVYTFTVVKTASATFSILASLTKFA